MVSLDAEIRAGTLDLLEWEDPFRAVLGEDVRILQKRPTAE